jgi:CHASE2 domain-containing sensor protein/signal transduction histidine kinase
MGGPRVAPPPPRASALARWGWFWMVAVGVALALGHANGLGRVENALIDHLSSLNGRAASPDIVIVAIDERSLDALGRWPWRRSVHAALLDRLHAAAPRAIGLDLILAESDGAYPVHDARLAEAIRRSANVVLPLHMQRFAGEAAPRAALPAPVLATSAAALGHIHVELGSDGVARSVFLREGVGERGWEHWTLALLRAGGEPIERDRLPGMRRPVNTAARTPDAETTWWRDHWLQVPFAGAPGHFRRVSYVDVLEGRVDSESLRGKYVLVGATAVGMGDAYLTPMASEDALMPGVEVSANVLDGLRLGLDLRRAERWENALFCVVPVVLALFVLYRLRPRPAFGAIVALMGMVYAACMLAQQAAGVQFAPLAALLCVALVYPLWSWFRLEAAIDYLAFEFRQIQHKDKLLTALPVQPATGDELDRRMLAMTAGVEQLRGLQRFVRDGLDSLSDAVLVTDRAGAILLTNHAATRYFGVAAETLQDRVVDDVLGPCVFPNGGGVLPALPASLDAAPAEFAGSDAQSRDLLLKCVPRRAPNGDLAGWIFSLVDISTVQQVQRQREEALRFISHDMRAPQSSILTLIELHRLDAQRPDPTLFDRIEGHARRTLALTDDFVHLARAQSDALVFEPVDLADVVVDAVDGFWDQATARRVDIVTEAEAGSCLCRADRGLLTRAVGNLIDNALKYGPQGARVHCALVLDGTSCTITVRDEGPGIAAEDQSALFEQFKRLGTDTRSGGAGLGLAFVQAVAARHNGSVDVRSRVGEGAEFRLHLPALSAALEPGTQAD